MVTKRIIVECNDGIGEYTAELWDMCGQILGIGHPVALISLMYRGDAMKLVLSPDLYNPFCDFIQSRGHFEFVEAIK